MHPPQPAQLTQAASPQVASQKYEEGEQALREARQVQSEQQARLQLDRKSTRLNSSH